MDVMELIDNLDSFIIVNGNTLKYNGDKYTNYALYGSKKDLLLKYSIDPVDLSKDEELNTDLVALAKSLVEKKAVLLLNNFGNIDNEKRRRFSTIYKDLSINGAKINYLGTIVFMDKDTYKLDFDEEDVFKKIR